MFTEVALLLVQLRTAVAPIAMSFGWALSEITGGAF